ncbi:MAG: signal peptidase II [Clostridiaceae bacterium]|nr:signal peptidase II [Clostridiaceae bacterium]
MVWAIIILLLAGADQLIKYIVEARISYGDSITVIPSFFHLINRRNTGAAWSFLADKDWGIYFLAAISALVTLVLIYIIFKTPYIKLKVVLTILVAGSVGNLIDRVFRGYVTDYLDFHFGSYAFPTFNLADILIVCSTAVLCILLFTDHRIIDHPFGLEKKDIEDVNNEAI